MHRHTLLQDDNEDLCVHQSGVQEPRPHKQQAAQEVAVVTEANTLAKKDAVVIPAQHTHFAVVAMGAPRRSVCLACITVPVCNEERKYCHLRSEMILNNMAQRKYLFKAFLKIY